MSTPPTHTPSRSLKRLRRVTRACDTCKARKRKCTGSQPCPACLANGSDCTYLASYTRGRLVQPLSNSNSNHPDRNSRATSPDSTFAGQYLGPTSPYSFLRRAWRRFDGSREGNLGGSGGSNGMLEDSTSSVFAYGDRQIPQLGRSEVEGFRLPLRSETLVLLAQYFDLAMPTYRFLHRQTVEEWLGTYHQLEDQVPRGKEVILLPSRQAVVLIVLATARLFNVDSASTTMTPDEQSWRESEKLFRAAESKLDAERGKARLEVVQARLAICLFLLHTHRPNQAWYYFGTTCQLVMALGLHRAAPCQDAMVRECRKRAFWAASTLDTYLSVVLGRPPLIHLDDVDQKHPDPVDDEVLTSNTATADSPPRDSVMKASVLHGQIVRIVKKAAREQYSVQRTSSIQKLETAANLNVELATWHASLPVVLSGVIAPSSLIPIFRRQITILQLAHAHARMLINRPSLLLSTSEAELRETQVKDCLSAAKAALESLLAAGLGENIFQIFWFMQFVCFNALSIVYVWLIQRRRGLLAGSQGISEEQLMRLAETMQNHLSRANQGNAPSLRYSVVLEELQQEVQRLNTAPAQAQRPPHLSAIMGHTSSDGSRNLLNPEDSETDRPIDSLAGDSLMDPFPIDFPLDPDLWLALDSFPFSDFGQLE